MAAGRKAARTRKVNDTVKAVHMAADALVGAGASLLESVTP